MGLVEMMWIYPGRFILRASYGQALTVRSYAYFYIT